MHIPDLELCRYHHGTLDADSWAVPLRAIGWLEHPHSYAQGRVPVGFSAKLRALVEETRTAFPRYTFRGVMDCTFCLADGRSSPGPVWSQENIIVPGDYEVYAAPGGVAHYVEAHGYLPPPLFISAVWRCPPCDSAEYLEALRVANAGEVPPVESHQEYSARVRRELQAVVQARERKNT